MQVRTRVGGAQVERPMDALLDHFLHQRCGNREIHPVRERQRPREGIIGMPGGGAEFSGTAWGQGSSRHNFERALRGQT